MPAKLLRKRGILRVKDVLEVPLEDDNTLIGGVSFQGETVEDIVNELGINYNTTLRSFNKILKECGIKKIVLYR